ncbi:Monocarboxylate transporter 14 [Portunus trituberculatus]|uniref:Monocarboxylate transporter 14 n=1 Tax=Portunus trituberculatus TaxID=210409 RepID=A0A5B7E501_PORTR|nr:Monocarboxylate transporter 14 [Portunus trituberculatus]
MSLITENSPLLEAPERNCTYGHGDLEKLEHREEYKNAEDKPLLGEDTAEDDSAPDGGWGWLVTLAGFVIWLLNGSCSAVFGVLFSGFLLDLGVSSSTTAWIQNLTFVLSNFCCYLMDPLVEEFGWRRVGLAMGVMNGCGLALSAFANSAHYLFFSYTVMAGIPIDILLTLTFAIVPHYFTTKRTLANSLMTTGSSFSIMVMPVVVTFLLDEYGFKQATLITAALYFNSCVAAMVFHPVEWHAKRPRPCTRRKVEVKTESSTLKRVAVNIKGNLRLLRSARVIIIGMVLGINVMGLFNFYYLVPFAMKAAGHTADEVGMCLMAAGIMVLVTRFCQPLIVMWANLTHQTALMMGSTIIATSTVGVYRCGPRCVTRCSGGASVGSITSRCGVAGYLYHFDLHKCLDVFE